MKCKYASGCVKQCRLRRAVQIGSQLNYPLVGMGVDVARPLEVFGCP